MEDRFVRVVSVHDLQPGGMKRLEIGGLHILLANVDGNFYAMDDTCSHEEASLSMGSLRGDLVTCPLHGSRFNVRTGSALEEPAEDDLRTYRTRLAAEEVFVELPE